MSKNAAGGRLVRETRSTVTVAANQYTNVSLCHPLHTVSQSGLLGLVDLHASSEMQRATLGFSQRNV